MKNRAMAVMVAATLLIAAGGESLAVGKLGGAGSGLEVAGGSGPVFVGKLGGASGADEFLLPPSLLAGKLGGVTGEEIGARVTGPEDVAGRDIALSAKLGVAGAEE